MAEAVRPDWPFRIEEGLARWLWGHHVSRLEHKWEMTGVDTARDWVEAVWEHDAFPSARSKGKDERRVVVIDGNELRFRPYHAGLLDLRDDIERRLGEIDEFERENESDRAEFERLKAKFA